MDTSDFPSGAAIDQIFLEMKGSAAVSGNSSTYGGGVYVVGNDSRNASCPARETGQIRRERRSMSL